MAFNSQRDFEILSIGQMNKKLWNDEVINSFLVEKRTELKLAETQKAVVVWDVIKGQMTEAAKQ